MREETPRYVPPAPDPGLALLTEQNERAKVDAIQDRVSSASARLMMMYGTRTALGGSVVTPLAPAMITRGDAPLTPANMLQIDPGYGAGR